MTDLDRKSQSVDRQDAVSVDRQSVDRKDAVLVHRLRESYGPAPLSPAERAAFDSGLRARIESGQRLFWLAPGLAAVAVLAAAVLWLPNVWRPFPGDVALVPEVPAVESSASVGRGEAAWVEWEESIFFPQLESARAGGSEALPGDYRAIASLILESS